VTLRFEVPVTGCQSRPVLPDWAWSARSSSVLAFVVLLALPKSETTSRFSGQDALSPWRSTSLHTLVEAARPIAVVAGAYGSPRAAHFGVWKDTSREVATSPPRPSCESHIRSSCQWSGPAL
jgi:hypothetical protein